MSEKAKHKKKRKKLEAKENTIDGFNFTKVNIRLSMSPKDYKELILKMENNSKEILLLSKRMTVMFKSELMIQEMAKKRFGEGSPHIEAYIDEHTLRKASFFSALESGCKIYEIHNKAELEKYLKERSHVGIGQVGYEHIIQMVKNWKKTMHDYPKQYFVALTEESIPFKYELVNREWMVIHESVGAQSDQRMNALFINSKEIVKDVRKDFFSIWERTNNVDKDKSNIDTWLDKIIKVIKGENEINE
ncbi:hypothetical protein D3Z62_09140 [Lachnospiraceae bacterium]|nr:hypothetical protein [Lachnospiraceae bacterium]